jgi:hypothetical protein
MDWMSRAPVTGHHPTEFILVGIRKELRVGYQERGQHFQALREGIANTAAPITPNMLENTWKVIDYGSDVCRTTRRACSNLN